MAFQVKMYPFRKFVPSDSTFSVYLLLLDAFGRVVVRKTEETMAYPEPGMVEFSAEGVTDTPYQDDIQWGVGPCWGLEVVDFCSDGYLCISMDDAKLVDRIDEARRQLLTDSFGEVVSTVYDPFEDDMATMDRSEVSLYDVRVKDGKVTVVQGGSSANVSGCGYGQFSGVDGFYADGMTKVKVDEWLGNGPRDIFFSSRVVKAIRAISTAKAA